MDFNADRIHLAGLREHLMAAAAQGQVAAALPGQEGVPIASSASPHDQNIDPAIAETVIDANASISNGDGEGEGSGEDGPDGSGKKGNKRELSTSKRAAQNRAAQVC